MKGRSYIEAEFGENLQGNVTSGDSQQKTGTASGISKAQAGTPLFVEELRLNMGLDGDSQPILDLVAQVYALSKTRAPVVFVGQPGVGKKKFANFLHRLTTSSETGCLFLSCDLIVKNGASCLQIDGYLQNMEAFQQQAVIIDRPELLPKNMCQELLVAFLMKNQGTFPRPIITIDIQAFSKLLVSLSPEIKAILQESAIHVPSMRERRSDVRRHILAKLRELNQMHKAAKRISIGSLEQLSVCDYPRNFHSLSAVIEKLFLAQDDVIKFDEKLVNDELQNGDLDMLLPELGEGFNLEEFLGNLRQRISWQALERADYNQTRCGEILGVSPQAINKFLRTQGLTRKQLCGG
jgi:DNA-binding NtrC family response regulator